MHYSSFLLPTPAISRYRQLKSAATNANSHGLEERQAPAGTLPGMAIYAVPADVKPSDSTIQTRPLPSRPNEEAIYNEAFDDSFSSGPDSFTSEPQSQQNTYANRDATYANGLNDGSAIYENGTGDASATYVNSGSEAGLSAPNVNGVRPGPREAGVRPGTQSPPVTVNGMQM